VLASATVASDLTTAALEYVVGRHAGAVVGAQVVAFLRSAQGRPVFRR